MTVRLKPPLKWHGGKYYVAPRVLELMPRHLNYVEGCFGGGQVFFARDPADPRYWWDGPDKDGRPCRGVSEVINDLDGDLMNFYAVLKDPGLFDRLRHRLELTLVSEAEWEAAGELLSGTAGDPVARAAALFVRVRQSRQALRKDFTTPTVNRLRGGRQESVNSWWGAVEGLVDVHRRLRDVLVLCRLVTEVIHTFDAPWTLFYLDPPYYHPTRTARKAYGRFEMTETDHRDLLATLKTVKGKVILSGYGNDLYDREVSDWNRHEVEQPNHAGGGKKKRRMTEVLWCNF
jgi:DNA adenine methylase